MSDTKTPISTRINAYRYDPDQLVVDPALRGRFSPPSDYEVAKLAASIADNGQASSILVRTVNKHPVVVAGFTRTAAGRLIKLGFTFEGKIYPPDPEFRLFGQESTKNDKEAILLNIAENHDRTDVSPIDTALNMRRLAEQHGVDRKEIAAVYRISLAQVGHHFQLLNLSDEERTLVHAGQMPMSTALALLDLKGEARTKVVKEAAASGDKIKKSAISDAIRAQVFGTDFDPTVLETPADRNKDGNRPVKKIAPASTRPKDKPEPKEAKAKAMLKGKGIAPSSVARSLADLKKFFMALDVLAYQDFFDMVQAQLEWLNGTISDKQFTAALMLVAELTVADVPEDAPAEGEAA